jgi:hypothetical protein
MSFRNSSSKRREAIASFIGLARVFWHLFSVEGRLVLNLLFKAEAQS